MSRLDVLLSTAAFVIAAVLIGGLAIWMTKGPQSLQEDFQPTSPQRSEVTAAPPTPPKSEDSAPQTFLERHPIEQEVSHAQSEKASTPITTMEGPETATPSDRALESVAWFLKHRELPFEKDRLSLDTQGPTLEAIALDLRETEVDRANAFACLCDLGFDVSTNAILTHTMVELSRGSQNPGVRELVISRLGGLSEWITMSTMMDALRLDEDEGVRRTALKRLSDHVARHDVRQVLDETSRHDPSERLRHQAGFVLTQWKRKKTPQGE